MSDNAAEKQPLLREYRSATPSSGETQPEQTLAKLQQNVATAQREYMKAWSKTTSGRAQRAVMLSTTLLLTAVFMISAWVVAIGSFSDELPLSGPVRVEAHIMSKCPDARDCLRELILPVMVEISDMVDFKLSYIGNITDHDDGVLCMHGPQECLGNIIQLCAAKLYPDPKIYLGFTMCMSKSYEDIAKQELVEDCALEHGISFQKLNTCATEDDGQHSVFMLQDSFKRSADANVSTSCTIRVAGKPFCVRDGGEWKDCPNGHEPADLIDAIKHKRSRAKRVHWLS